MLASQACKRKKQATMHQHVKHRACSSSACAEEAPIEPWPRRMAGAAPATCNGVLSVWQTSEHYHCNSAARCSICALPRLEMATGKRILSELCCFSKLASNLNKAQRSSTKPNEAQRSLTKPNEAQGGTNRSLLLYALQALRNCEQDKKTYAALMKGVIAGSTPSTPWTPWVARATFRTPQTPWTPWVARATLRRIPKQRKESLRDMAS